MLVNQAFLGDWTVLSPSARLQRFASFLRPYLGNIVARLMHTNNPLIHSPSILPSRYPNVINDSDADVINLHWVNKEMLSIADIGRITKPLVWTLHDMWAFCGAEHCADSDRWRVGYNRTNRPKHESGLDLNRWTWKRKQRRWRRPIQIVAPSRWLADCVQKSALMADWPVTVIPNALDTDLWQPVDRRFARELLGLNPNSSVVLFGAIGGTKLFHKGFDLLKAALSRLCGEGKDLSLLIFGQLAPREPEQFGFPTHYMGHLSDDLSLKILYSAADVLVNPSRQEAFGQTASEAQACGTPVVAFDNSGLADIVLHKQTGYLAKAFDPEDLARGILWVLQHEQCPSKSAGNNGGKTAQVEQSVPLSANARFYAVRRFSYSAVSAQYADLYRKVLKN
jgi:glycosyltransferase involved in cell wall biosynthesis